MTETNALLILSKATLRTGGLEALRAQINAAQNQKCFGLKDLLLAVRRRRCSYQGRAWKPNRWCESLVCITAIQQSRLMGGFQRCPY